VNNYDNNNMFKALLCTKCLKEGESSMTNIKPFFHLKNYKAGIYDAILKKGVDETPRSPEYKEGYDFGMYLYNEQQKQDDANDETPRQSP
jgi:hypothetical protein